MNIIVVDTETLGVPADDQLSYTYVDNWPQIRQISWLVYDKIGQLLKKMNCYTRPPQLNNIPQDYPTPIIQSIDIIANAFLLDFNNCDVLIGHNIAYDKSVIACELYRLGIDPSRLFSIPCICTMLQGIHVCGFSTRQGDRYPTLQELYTFLFHHPFNFAHDAFYDASATAECFWEMKNKSFLIGLDSTILMTDSQKKEYGEECLNKGWEIVNGVTSGSDKDAANYYLMGAKVGNVQCMYKLGLMHRGGLISIDNDRKEAKKWLNKAVEGGCLDAYNELEKIYTEEGNIEKTNYLNNKWFDYHVKNFDSLSNLEMDNYISVYLYGRRGKTKDLTKARQLCERAISLGWDNYTLYARVLLALGDEKGYFNNMLKALDPVRENFHNVTLKKKTLYPWEKENYAFWLREYIRCYFNGKGTCVDYFKAKELIDDAMSVYPKDSEVLYYLGQYYEFGFANTRVDYEKAFECYNKATSNAEACKRLGILYLSGKGCIKSKKKAREYLQIALDNGIDVSPFYEKAKSWF